MITPALWSNPFRVSDLPARKPTRFTLTPDSPTRKAIAAHLGISEVRKLTFSGELRPTGRRDWMLEATLGATVVQPCIVSLAPVTTRIDETVTRRYLSDMQEPQAEDVEMPDDDTAEPLPAVIDAGGVMVEALALALPLYPRAEDAALDTAQFTEPGKAPMTDEDTRPFAGLADLIKKGDDER